MFQLNRKKSGPVFELSCIRMPCFVQLKWTIWEPDKYRIQMVTIAILFLLFFRPEYDQENSNKLYISHHKNFMLLLSACSQGCIRSYMEEPRTPDEKTD